MFRSADPEPRPSRARWLGVLAALLMVPIVAAYVFADTPEPQRRAANAPAPATHAKYATQSSDRAATRKASAVWKQREHLDSAAEACEARTVEGWARLMGVAATPEVVAQEFAERNYERILQPTAAIGCLKGLLELD